MSLILRGDKGQKLTISELDNNFQYLESLIGTGGGGSTASFLYEGSLVLETLDEDKLFNNSTNYELPLTLTQSYNLKGMFLTQSFEFIQNIGEGGLTASFRIDTTMFNGFAELELEFGISLYAPITYQKLDYYVLETIELFEEGLVVKLIKSSIDSLFENDIKVDYLFSLPPASEFLHTIEFEEAPSNVFGDSNINPVYERFSLDSIGELTGTFSGYEIGINPYIEFGNLPTSSSGLQSGQLWVDTANDNVIKVFYPS
jgi:hypothetical protein